MFLIFFGWENIDVVYNTPNIVTAEYDGFFDKYDITYRVITDLFSFAVGKKHFTYKTLRVNRAEEGPKITGYGRPFSSRVDYIIYLPKTPKYILCRIYGGGIEDAVNFESVDIEDLEEYLKNDIAVINLRLSDLYDPPETKGRVAQAEFSSAYVEFMLDQVAGFITNLTSGKADFSGIKDPSIRERLSFHDVIKVLTGSSYGGFLTLLMATHKKYNSFFHAYIPEMGPSYKIKRFPFKQTRAILINFMEHYLNKPEIPINFEQYLSETQSPLLGAKNISRKILLIHGLLDNIVDISHSMFFYAATPKKQQKFIELYFDRHMGHDEGMTPSSQARRLHKIIEFIKNVRTEAHFEIQNEQMMKLFYKLRKMVPDYKSIGGEIFQGWSLKEQLEGYTLNEFINNPEISNEEVVRKFLLRPNIFFDILKKRGMNNVDNFGIVIENFKQFLKKPEDLNPKYYDELEGMIQNISQIKDFCGAIFNAYDDFRINIGKEYINFNKLKEITQEKLDDLEDYQVVAYILNTLYNNEAIKKALIQERFGAAFNDSEVELRKEQIIREEAEKLMPEIDFDALRAEAAQAKMVE